MPATESNEQQLYAVVAGVSMRDLLASCAAANAISTPPRLPDPEASAPPSRHREAA
ncbi:MULTISPECIES: hypothetical protein [unclassified Streptomyces]|uniref:hypothetical protein n=1 Tax=unclassified Streptomyces TaxID=2593676 RepID=UPI00225A8068|nr:MULTISPECIES: hypothetical protein [unclassified Streptomyces]MCX4883012.1 hypothetical protein [Streptomyces sp. NBC_00847]MCX5423050.1 hypothetical protein [Streptomyces sp. NBC_00078]